MKEHIPDPIKRAMCTVCGSLLIICQYNKEYLRLINSHTALVEAMKDLVAKSNTYRRSHMGEPALEKSIVNAKKTISQAEGK